MYIGFGSPPHDGDTEPLGSGLPLSTDWNTYFLPLIMALKMSSQILECETIFENKRQGFSA